MEIEDAFIQEAIEMADTNVGGDEEDELRKVIRQIYESNELELTRDHENIAVLCFVAGRTNQVQSEPEISIPLRLAGPFIEFLAQRGET